MYLSGYNWTLVLLVEGLRHLRKKVNRGSTRRPSSTRNWCRMTTKVQLAGQQMLKRCLGNAALVDEGVPRHRPVHPSEKSEGLDMRRNSQLLRNGKARLVALLVAAGSLGWASGPAAAAVRIEGQVQAGRGPVAQSTMTLWAASDSAPARLAQTQTGADGRFVISAEQTPSGAVLYLVAAGGEPAVNKAGKQPCDRLPVGAGRHASGKCRHQRDDHRRFGMDQRAVPRRHRDKGHALGLRIAAGNVPNFVDLETGGWGTLFRTRSTAARRRQWPISPRWPMCCPVAPRW